MRNTFFTILAGISLYTSAQNPCGTVQTESDLAWLRNWQENHVSSGVRGGDQYYIPLKVHIVGLNDGTGYINTSVVLQNICDLNEQFAPVGFVFYLYEEINYINNSTFYNHDWDAGYTMMITNNDYDAVNMYYVGDPAGNCGYYSPAGNAVAIANSCGGIGNSTNAHELGHYFSLPHTFYGWEWGEPPLSDQEQVDGGNCNSAADGFCDTPADYASWRWFCSSPPNFTDPDGVDFNPDGTYFMSYSDDNCQDKFSDEQIESMNDYLQGPKDYLLEHPAITYTDVDSTTLLTPVDGAVYQYPNFTTLSWEPIEGATGYNLQVSYTTGFTSMKLDVFTTETTYIADNLAPEQKYYWRVRVLGEANSCENPSAYQSFETGAEYLYISSINENTQHKGLVIYPNPVDGYAEKTRIDIEMKQGEHAVITLTDMTGRTLATQNVTGTGGFQSITVSFPALAQGMYMLILKGEETFASGSFMVK